MSIKILSWNTKGDPRTDPVKIAAFNSYLPSYDYVLLQQCGALANLTDYNLGKPYQCCGVLHVGSKHAVNAVAALSIHQFTRVDDIDLQNNAGKCSALIQDEVCKKRYIGMIYTESENIKLELRDLNQFLEPCRRHQNSKPGAQLKYSGDHSGFELIVATNSSKPISGTVENSDYVQRHNNWCYLKSNSILPTPSQQACYLYYWRSKPIQPDQLIINPEILSVNNSAPDDSLPLLSYWH